MHIGVYRVAGAIYARSGRGQTIGWPIGGRERDVVRAHARILMRIAHAHGRSTCALFKHVYAAFHDGNAN